MAAQDKTVKITIVVDDAAAQKAKRAIMEIKQEVDRLVESTSKLGGFLGGLGAAKVGNKAGTPGSGSATQLTHSQAGGALGGITTAIAGGAKAGAAEIKKTAEATTQSFKSMKDNLKSLVDAQDREARRMEGIWGRVRRMMGQAMGGPGGGPLPPGVSGPPLGGAGGGRNVGGGSNAGGGGAVGVTAPPGSAPPGNNNGGGSSRGSKQGGGILGGNGFIAGVGQQFGLPVGLASSAAAVGAGVGIAAGAVSASNSNYMANLNYELDRPFTRGAARATVGDIMGGNAQAVRHGDMARLHAMNVLSSDKERQKILDQDWLLEHKRMKEHPVTFREAMLNGRKADAISGAAGEFFGGSLSGDVSSAAKMGSFDRYMTKVIHPVKGQSIIDQADREYNDAKEHGMAVNNRNILEVENEMAREKEITLQMERDQRMLEQKMREDPGFNDRFNTVYGRATSDSGLMRSLGMSGRDKTYKGADRTGTTPQDVTFNGAAIVRARAESEGRDVGEYSAAFSKASQYGRRFAERSWHSILSPETGGMYNAAALKGVGNMFGGNLYGAMQGGVGRGGLDVVAGSNIGEVAMKTIMSGQWNGSGGAGLMSTLLDAAYTGKGDGADMVMARRMGEGMNRREQEQAGSIDGLNKALQMKAAMTAAPAAPWTVRNMLLGMTEGELLDIVKSGNVPKQLADNGVTAEMATKFWNAKNATSLAGVGRTREYATDDQLKLTDQYTKTGGLGFLKGKSPEEVETVINKLAGARAGKGGTLSEHVAALRIEASGMGLLSGAHGRGVGDTLAKGTTLAAMNEARGQQAANEARHMGSEGGIYKADVANVVAKTETMNKERAKAQGGITAAGDAGQAIAAVSKALDNFVQAMKSMVEKPGAPGPKRASP